MRTKNRNSGLPKKLGLSLIEENSVAVQMQRDRFKGRKRTIVQDIPGKYNHNKRMGLVSAGAIAKEKSYNH